MEWRVAAWSGGVWLSYAWPSDGSTLLSPPLAGGADGGGGGPFLLPATGSEGGGGSEAVRVLRTDGGGGGGIPAEGAGTPPGGGGPGGGGIPLTAPRTPLGGGGTGGGGIDADAPRTPPGGGGGSDDTERVLRTAGVAPSCPGGPSSAPTFFLIFGGFRWADAASRADVPTTFGPGGEVTSFGASDTERARAAAAVTAGGGGGGGGGGGIEVAAGRTAPGGGGAETERALRVPPVPTALPPPGVLWTSAANLALASSNFACLAASFTTPSTPLPPPLARPSSHFRSFTAWPRFMPDVRG